MPSNSPLPCLQHATSDITAEYPDIGGDVNPLGYKGYRFTPNSYGYTSRSTINSRPHPPLFQKLAPRRTEFPAYQFSDDSDEQVLSMKIPPPISLPVSAPKKHDASKDEHYLCCPLMGPITPFLGKSTLNDVGTSSVLPHNLYMFWRFVLLSYSSATLITTALREVRYLAYVQGAALTMSVFLHILLLWRALMLRRSRVDAAVLSKQLYCFGWDAFVFQSALHLCVMVPVIYGAFHIFVPGFVFAGVNYIGSASSYMLLAVTVLHVAEIAIVPIPFRVTHILPIAFYSLVLCLFALGSNGYPFSILLVVAVFAICFVTGICLSMFNRGIYLIYHRHHIDTTDKTEVSDAQANRDQV